MIRPMLAATLVEEEDIRFPVYVSPKLDGIRCLMKDGRPMSRSGEVLPNKFIQDWAMKNAEILHGLDGELIVGAATGEEVYNRSQSGIMSREGEPDFTYHVFDNWLYPMEFFLLRYKTAAKAIQHLNDQRACMVPQVPCPDLLTLNAFFDLYTQQGYEGLIGRNPEGRYKNGRSTTKEGLLFKMKQWDDSEAEILEVVELMKNDNPPKYTELGYMKRSSHKANKIPAGTLGSLLVRDIHTGVEFPLGKGTLKRVQQDELWATKDQLPGVIVKYKFMGYGVKDKPRQPILLGLRTEIDL